MCAAARSSLWQSLEMGKPQRQGTTGIVSPVRDVPAGIFQGFQQRASKSNSPHKGSGAEPLPICSHCIFEVEKRPFTWPPSKASAEHLLRLPKPQGPPDWSLNQGLSLRLLEAWPSPFPPSGWWKCPSRDVPSTPQPPWRLCTSPAPHPETFLSKKSMLTGVIPAAGCNGPQ